MYDKLTGQSSVVVLLDKINISSVTETNKVLEREKGRQREKEIEIAQKSFCDQFHNLTYFIYKCNKRATLGIYDQHNIVCDSFVRKKTKANTKTLSPVL